ncbi:MAG: RNA polymerase sigma-70 factor [Chitinophagaceae bacterium]
MSPEEALTWKKIQQKDVGAFEGFYKEEYKSFFLMAFKYLKDADLSQEVVNDVFMKLWEDGIHIHIEKSLKSYVYRAVINRSITVLNKQKKESGYLKEFSHVPQDTYELRQMEENELKVALYKAINRLPEQCKRVFCMSRFDQLKQQEIADKLGISIKTVKNHITHALKLLNKARGEYWIFLLTIMKELFLGH